MTLKRSKTCQCDISGAAAKWRWRFLLWNATALAAFALAGCRMDMHVQPKYTTDKPTAFFDDERSERPEVPGTVAHGEAHGGELLYTGLIEGKPADAFPFTITATDLDRGRDRYNIYRSPCHDYNAARVAE